MPFDITEKLIIFPRDGKKKKEIGLNRKKPKGSIHPRETHVTMLRNFIRQMQCQAHTCIHRRPLLHACMEFMPTHKLLIDLET